MPSEKSIIYFTESYPYGLGENWKRDELKVLAKHFKKVIVVPFQFGDNHKPKPKIDGVEYHPPLFDKIEYPTFKEKAKIFTSRNLLVFIVEFFKSKSYQNRNKFSYWLSDSVLIDRLYSNKQFQNLLIGLDRSTILYFFWGRGSSMVLALNILRKWKSVIRLHGYDLYSSRNSINYIHYQSSQIQNASLVLPISEHGLRYLQETYPNYMSKFHLSRLGTSPSSLSKRSSGNVFNIVSCSSIIPIKRLHLISQALNLINTININWVHIGGGEYPSELKLANEKLEKKSNINTKFIGMVPADQVMEYYRTNEVDLFINVSSTEGLPVSIMECMSAGIPAYATNVGGTSEIVNSKNGKLLDPNISPESLAKELLEFSSFDSDKIMSLKMASISTFNARFNSTTNAKYLATLLDNLR
jgi:glycosyltransferase involved in cell wall biosynthesis